MSEEQEMQEIEINQDTVIFDPSPKAFGSLRASVTNGHKQELAWSTDDVWVRITSRKHPGVVVKVPLMNVKSVTECPPLKVLVPKDDDTPKAKATKKK